MFIVSVIFETMKISFYKSKLYRNWFSGNISFSIRGMFHTHEFIFDYEENIAPVTTVSHLLRIDCGPYIEAACPHMIKTRTGYMQMYIGDIIKYEYEGKSEYWMATINSWHKLL